MRHPGLRGSFWPTRTQEALIRVTLGSADHADETWRRIQPIDVRSLDAGSFCLLPLLYERLSEVAPNDVRRPLLLGTYRSTWYRNQLLLERLSALLPRFRERGIDPLLVGGTAIVLRWYPRLGSRPVAQLELVVDPAAGSTAHEATVAAGWRLAGRTVAYRRFVEGSGGVLVVHEGVPPLVAGPLGRAAAHAELRSGARQQIVLEESVAMLQACDELLFACSLGARTAVPPSVQWLLDASMILTALDRPDPALLLARARMLHLVEPLRDTIAYLAQVAGVSGLEEYTRALAAEPACRRDSVAYRLGGAGVERFGGIPLAFAAHLRATSTQPIPRVIAGIPRHLQHSWEAESLRHVPPIALKKLLRLARRRRGAGGAPHQTLPASGLERNRSASS